MENNYTQALEYLKHWEGVNKNENDKSIYFWKILRPNLLRLFPYPFISLSYIVWL